MHAQICPIDSCLVLWAGWHFLPAKHKYVNSIFTIHFCEAPNPNILQQPKKRLAQLLEFCVCIFKDST